MIAYSQRLLLGIFTLRTLAVYSNHKILKRSVFAAFVALVGAAEGLAIAFEVRLERERS